ncbi:MAG TPA: hypothetical protein VM120_07065 [Bryobacteraceae bacterium]|nr:hypothetical protein [Bryobacteraceae bacterium]
MNVASISDCTGQTKIELQGTAVAHPLTPPDGFRFYRLGRTRALIAGKQPAPVVDDWLKGFAPRTVYSTDVTSVFADFLLIGPRARDILSKLTSLNVSEGALADGGCAQASLAHTHCIVLREDRGGLPAFHLLVARDYGVSVWEALLHAGEEFHLRPAAAGAGEAL